MACSEGTHGSSDGPASTGTLVGGFDGRLRAKGRVVIFDDRADAGRRLGRALAHYRDQRPIVFGLPRGGVPVAAEVARALGAPLDVFVARKLGVPTHPELAFGAVAEDGTVFIDALAAELGLDAPTIERIAAREGAEAARRVARFRGGRSLPAVRGRVAIVVDDGIATGATARVAVRALRSLAPSRLVLATPVASPSALASLSAEVDDLVCLYAPHAFEAVGLWYREFEQVPDGDVVTCLEAARATQ
jgi:putative phosphoribosyl transferase